jgi:hypothetical protein
MLPIDALEVFQQQGVLLEGLNPISRLLWLVSKLFFTERKHELGILVEEFSNVN